jgi:hypothetical protein
MARDPSSLRPGQHALSGAAFLTVLPLSSVAVLLVLRFAFARGLLSPLVTLLSYWAGACCMALTSGSAGPALSTLMRETPPARRRGDQGAAAGCAAALRAHAAHLPGLPAVLRANARAGGQP